MFPFSRVFLIEKIFCKRVGKRNYNCRDATKQQISQSITNLHKRSEIIGDLRGCCVIERFLVIRKAIA